MPPINEAYKQKLLENDSQSVRVSPLIFRFTALRIITAHNVVDTELTTANPRNRNSGCSTPANDTSAKHTISTTMIFLKLRRYRFFIVSLGIVEFTIAARPTDMISDAASTLGPIKLIKCTWIIGDVAANTSDISACPNIISILVCLSICLLPTQSPFKNKNKPPSDYT